MLRMRRAVGIGCATAALASGIGVATAARPELKPFSASRVIQVFSQHGISLRVQRDRGCPKGTFNCRSESFCIDIRSGRDSLCPQVVLLDVRGARTFRYELELYRSSAEAAHAVPQTLLRRGNIAPLSRVRLRYLRRGNVVVMYVAGVDQVGAFWRGHVTLAAGSLGPVRSALAEL
jgi:hypothetical protein